MLKDQVETPFVSSRQPASEGSGLPSVTGGLERLATLTNVLGASKNLSLAVGFLHLIDSKCRSNA